MLSFFEAAKKELSGANKNKQPTREVPPPAAAPNNRGRQGRIPATLQAVFLASNRGKDVYKPPPQGVASKVFFRNWFFQRQSGSGKKKGSFGSSKGTMETEKSRPPLTVEVQKKTPKSSSVPSVVSKDSVKAAPAAKVAPEPLTPQAYLDAMLSKRGYATKRFKTLQTAYYSKPTPLQQASYDVHMIDLVRKSDMEGLAAILAAGISPNPCNKFGESLVHMVCRRGDHKLLQTLLDHGCDLQVADDYGRTPLHDACWAATPCFGVIELILAKDIRLFHMMDCRGAVPLSYVRKDHWSAWIEFLSSKRNIFWPPRSASEGDQSPPPLTLEPPNTRVLREPDNALTVELATMVSAGRMEPEEAQYLKYGQPEEEEETDEDETSEYSDDDEEYDSDDDSLTDDEDDYELDEAEMADILNSLGGRVPVPSPAVLSAPVPSA